MADVELSPTLWNDSAHPASCFVTSQIRKYFKQQFLTAVGEGHRGEDAGQYILYIYILDIKCIKYILNSGFNVKGQVLKNWSSFNFQSKKN